MIQSHTSGNDPEDPDELLGDGVAEVDDGEALAGALDGDGGLDDGAAVVGATVGDGLPGAWLSVAAGRAPPVSLARATPVSTPPAIPAAATSTAASSTTRRMSIIVIGPLSTGKALPPRTCPAP
jgi:hypothetical protein